MHNAFTDPYNPELASPPDGTGFPVEADRAYEVMIEALMTGADPLDALVSTPNGFTVPISACSTIGEGAETIRDILKRAQRDMEAERPSWW